MSTSYLFVLVASEKASLKTGGAFNFDIAYSEFMIYYNSARDTLHFIPRDMFMKIFIDVTNKGFLWSESSDDITGVNNKIYLGVKGLCSKIVNLLDRIKHDPSVENKISL